MGKLDLRVRQVKGLFVCDRTLVNAMRDPRIGYPDVTTRTKNLE